MTMDDDAAAKGDVPSASRRLKDGHEFVVPTKQVKSVFDVKKWEDSEAYQDYLSFIFAVGDAIKGVKISQAQSSAASDGLLSMLDELSRLVDEIPPQEQQQRFGNRAFRDWHAKMKEGSARLLEKALPKLSDPNAEARRPEALRELSVYLEASFGDPTRIDYGTGHEMNFAMFCFCLFRVGAVEPSGNDLQSVGLSVFHRYLALVRKLQLTYRMEPAGSQGVWSLDDHQFVAFLWGAAQLVDHPTVGPSAIPDYAVADQLSEDHLFFSCVQHIGKVKTGPFAEHSNQLWNVSGVPSWSKVYSGLVKMYRKEVLCKFPIIQHTFFGSLLTLREAKERPASARADGASRGRPQAVKLGVPLKRDGV